MLAIIIAVYLWHIPPIPQNPLYHHFADGRTLWDIPNALNVITNIPFLIIGFMGLIRVIKIKDEYSLFYAILFFGIIWICFGSSSYHWHPDNTRLVWDRLPMTIAFMSLFSAIIAERISLKAGRWLLLPMLLLGTFSVLYWYYTEIDGHGDLRLYVFIQFFPMLAIPYLLLLFPPQYTAVHYLWFSLISYLLAKICEFNDNLIYQITHHIISGHSIKHLLAALSAFFIYRYICARKKINVS